MALTNHQGRDLSTVADFCTSTRGAAYVIRHMRNGKYRLYEDTTSYSSGHGGQCIQWGKVVLDYSPTAGEREGKPAEFLTIDQAADYAKRWL